MPNILNKQVCNNNGIHELWTKKQCKCYPCYKGNYCIKVVGEFCEGRVAISRQKLEERIMQPNRKNHNLEKCICGPLKDGPCCQRDKCFGPGSSWSEFDRCCKCGKNRHGTNCEKISRCLNGGKSIEKNHFRVCKCPNKFRGTACETPLCGEHGTLNYERTNCDCAPFHFGRHCEVVTCANGGTLDFSGTRCHCRWLYTGQFCEVMVNAKLNYVGATGIFAMICLCLTLCKLRFTRTVQTTRNTRAQIRRNIQTSGRASSVLANSRNSNSFAYDASGRIPLRYAQYLTAISDRYSLFPDGQILRNGANGTSTNGTNCIIGTAGVRGSNVTLVGGATRGENRTTGSYATNVTIGTNGADGTISANDANGANGANGTNCAIYEHTHGRMTPPPDYCQVAEEEPPPYCSIFR